MTSLISRGGKGNQLCLQHNKQTTAVEIICYFSLAYGLQTTVVFSQNTEWFITPIYSTFYFFLYKLTRLKAVHSTLLFIVVIAVRWSHRQAYRGSIRSFILSFLSREQLTEASQLNS